MLGKSYWLAGTALALLVSAGPALAQNQTLEQRVEGLEQKLGVTPPPNATLDQRVKAIEDRLSQAPPAAAPAPAQEQRIEAVEQQQIDTRTRLSTLEQQFADTQWTFDNLRPTVQSADGRFTMALRYRFQFDTALFNQSSNVNTVTPTRNVAAKDLASGSMVRRFYVGVEGRAFRDFSYELRLDFGGSSAEATNPIVNLARVAYNIGNVLNPGAAHFRINAGILQPIITYGDTVSSSSTTFLERGDIVNVATTGYGGQDPRRGIELTFQQIDIFRPGDNLVLSAAYTGQQPGANPASPSNTTDEGTQIIGRAAYRLWSDGFSNVQIGASGSHIINVTGNATPGGARNITLQDRPEVRVDGTRLVAATVPSSGGYMWGLDGGGNFKNFFLYGEYMKFELDRDVHCTGCAVSGVPAGVNPGNPNFSGWYIEGSWILTGETKTYSAFASNNEMATFNNPRVITPFSLDGNSWGAWELAARYSDLDLNWHQGSVGQNCATVASIAGCVRGGDQKIWTFGMNWYLNNNVLMRFNYMLVDINRIGTSSPFPQIGQKFNVAALRLQLTN